VAGSPGRTLGQWLNAHKLREPRDRPPPPQAGRDAAKQPAVPRQLPPLPPAKGTAAAASLPPKPPAVSRAPTKTGAAAASAAAVPPAAAAAAAAAGSGAAAADPADTQVAPLHSGNPPIGPHLLGRRLKVWWPLDHAYYHGTVKSFHADTVRRAAGAWLGEG
jgi:hypothetical protein